MEKIYRLQNLDCANCAAKMERKIAKITGVISVSVNFMAQKMILELDENNFEEIKKQVVTICKKIEPDCQILGI
ncbi:MAG TPA: heavy-metal-associated domain-containing protein [Clostridia bacterium]|nr:heavy-metal-associated domain-containing protein [Clostridia bacterium]